MDVDSNLFKNIDPVHLYFCKHERIKFQERIDLTTVLTDIMLIANDLMILRCLKPLLWFAAIY